MDKLWALIQDEADAVRGYYDTINTLKEELGNDECAMACKVLMMIISDERDHLEALTKLYEIFSKEKPATDVQDFVNELYTVYKDRNKILK